MAPDFVHIDELDWLVRGEAESAERRRFEWHGVSGSLMLITSATWRAQHLPQRCFDQRHLDRVEQRNPRKLWQRSCSRCGKDILTNYAPERPEIVYCETCYLDEVY